VKPEAQIFEGSKAQRLLEDEAFIQAFKDVKQAILDKWEAAPLRDREGAHELKLMLKLLADLKANLEMAVNNGKMAAAELKQSREKPTKWWAINRG
jgi:hypothetical protein